MDFNHTEERQMLADTVGRFVQDKYAIDVRHKIVERETGYDPDQWREMAELGLVGALFPEEAGGFGGAGFDIMVVFEQLGRGLVVEPFLPNLLAGTALLRGTDAQRALIEEAIAGETMLAFAHGEPKGRYDLAHVETTAAKDDDGWTLHGAKAVVLGGDAADHLVVSARVSGDTTDRAGIALFLVPAAAVERRGYPTADGYRAAEVRLDGVRLGADALIAEDALTIVEDVHARGIVAVCAEALGAMQVAADMTLDYLKTRKQFGVVIGKFQALAHRMADVLTEIEQTRSIVINAAGHLDGEDRDWHVSAAKNYVGRAGKLVAEEAIQLHGGIAMTWEYAVGHYSKRLIMIDAMFGDTDHHLERCMKLSREKSVFA